MRPSKLPVDAQVGAPYRSCATCDSVHRTDYRGMVLRTDFEVRAESAELGPTSVSSGTGNAGSTLHMTVFSASKHVLQRFLADVRRCMVCSLISTKRQSMTSESEHSESLLELLSPFRCLPARALVTQSGTARNGGLGRFSPMEPWPTISPDLFTAYALPKELNVACLPLERKSSSKIGSASLLGQRQA